MIPRIIHYCWFGTNPISEQEKKCINSWKKFCPDYEIKEWNETNFDINICEYVREAYEEHKWAFVSDFARFWILYNFGGIYFDTDVEMIRNIDDIVEKGPFMAKEPYKKKYTRIAPGLGLGTEPNNPFYGEILEIYKKKHYRISERTNNDETIVTLVSRIAAHHGYKGNSTTEEIEGIHIYAPEFFCPVDPVTGELTVTANTRAVHWYSASWKSEQEIEIHKKALKIYHNLPFPLGRLLGSTYENLMKVIYYTKQEGVSGMIKRIVRKVKQ